MIEQGSSTGNTAQGEVAEAESSVPGSVCVMVNDKGGSRRLCVRVGE